MKKTLVISMALVALVSFSTVSFAQTTRSNLGCGLGTQVIPNQKSLLMHIVAGWLNALCCNQTFGITTGTSGCTQFQGLVFNDKVDSFIASNMDNLATDIAKGNGEYLDTLATLMEVKQEQRTDFNATLQNNFSKIYTSGNVSSEEVVRNIGKVTNS